MALRAAPVPIEALRVVSRGRRGIAATVTVRATELDDLRMEIRAAGQEMRAAGLRVQYAIHTDRDDLALQTAASLIVRGTGYSAR